MAYLAYKLDDDSRRALLAAIPPAYAQVKVDHITKRYIPNVIAERYESPPAMPHLHEAHIVAVVDDGNGIQAALVEIDGQSRNGTAFYHVTLSYDESKKVPDGWQGPSGDEYYEARYSNHLLHDVLNPEGKPWDAADTRIRWLDTPLTLAVRPVYVDANKQEHEPGYMPAAQRSV